MKAIVVSLMGWVSVVLAAAAEVSELGIPIPNACFDFGGGSIPRMTGAATERAMAASVTQEVGTSGWIGRVCPSFRDDSVFRPGLDVEDGASGAGVARIQRHAEGTAVGGDVEAELWNPLAGFPLAPNSIYTFSVDVDAGRKMTVEEFVAQGFGVGVTTGASRAESGEFYADSLDPAALFEVSTLKGTNQRLSFTFSTGPEVPPGDTAVVIFVRHTARSILPASVCDYQLDNTSLWRRRNLSPIPARTRAGTLGVRREQLTIEAFGEQARLVPVVPEPSTGTLLLSGSLLLARRRRSGRSATRRLEVRVHGRGEGSNCTASTTT
jgi:hypothetical protein